MGQYLLLCKSPVNYPNHAQPNYLPIGLKRSQVPSIWCGAVLKYSRHKIWVGKLALRLICNMHQPKQSRTIISTWAIPKNTLKTYCWQYYVRYIWSSLFDHSYNFAFFFVFVNQWLKLGSSSNQIYIYVPFSRLRLVTVIRSPTALAAPPSPRSNHY